jgi:hypothetical protein
VSEGCPPTWSHYSFAVSAALSLGLYLTYWASAVNISTLNQIIFEHYSESVVRSLIVLFSIFVLCAQRAIVLSWYVVTFAFGSLTSTFVQIMPWSVLGLLVGWNVSLLCLIHSGCELSVEGDVS